MKRIATDPRKLLLAGALVAVAGIAWGAGLRPQAGAALRPVAVTPAPSTAAEPSASVVTPTTLQPTEAAAISPTGAQTASEVAMTPTNMAGQSGMRIFRDPETGEIGPPTAEMIAAMGESAPVDVSNLKQVTLPDGSVMMDLQGHFQETMVMQIDANGKRSVKCVTDPKASIHEAPVAKAPAQTREEK